MKQDYSVKDILSAVDDILKVKSDTASSLDVWISTVDAIS